MSPRTILLIVALTALLAAASCRSTHGSGNQPQAEPGEKTEHAEDTVTLSADEIESSGIQTSVVVDGSISETASIQGRVMPRAGHQAPVTSPFPGRMIAPEGGLPIPGSTVKQGQLLGFVQQELSATEYTAVNEKRIELDSQVEQTEREVTQKTRDLERARTLYEGGVIALKQLQQTETDLHTAEARRTAAQRARASYNALASSSGPRRIGITAPISGRIMTVNTAPGQQVDSARVLFEIADLSIVWVEAQVFEDYLSRIRGARTLEITARAAPGESFSGRLLSVTQQVDPVNKTEGVIFEAANRNGVLAIGMNVDVRVPSGLASTGPLIPASALIESEGRSVVFVEQKPGVYEQREVKTGARDRSSVLIVEGVKAGDKVVSTGAQVLAAARESSGEEEEKEK